MNKMREFLLRHEEELKQIGIIVLGGAGIVICCVSCYRAGEKNAVLKLCDRFNGGLGRLLRTAVDSKDMYGEIMGPDIVKFGDLNQLAKRAIEFDSSHLEDHVTGLFVFTNKR